MIFVGRLLANKNVNVLIESVALLKTTYPQIKCIIVGRGPEKNTLIKLVQDHELLENVKFIESIEDHRQLYALMKASRVFAFPSTREGFGIVVLEANGCGLPVITTDYHQNASRHLIQEGLNGKTITLSKESLANALYGYLAMSPEPTRYASFLQQYDWNTLTQHVEKLYTQGLSIVASKELLHMPETDEDIQAVRVREEVLVGSDTSVRTK